MKKLFALKASLFGGIVVCFIALLTSCLGSGDESISLEPGEAEELILGEWRVSDCTFVYMDADGIEIEKGIPSDSWLDTLLEFDFSGDCYVNDGEQTYTWSIDSDNRTFLLNGITYHLVSIGKNLIVIEITGTIDGETGTIRYLLKRVAAGEVEDFGIPSDALATPNPDIEDPNTSIPNIQLSADGKVISIDMTGVQNPAGGWMELFGTNSPDQNIWVTVDGKPKGILVINNAGNNSNARAVDLVFLVDNSGSMGQEADAVARDIVAWAQELANSGLDIRFGCVGYESGVNGALNLTGLTEISAYLNRGSGVGRTKGYGGSDASALSSAASRYHQSRGECGAEALHFANENFSFRSGANRIYVNFTDEPNQPGSYTQNSVEYFKSQENWNTAQGTVHTVYSDANKNVTEKPWLLSEYTGGTTLYANSSFTGVSLSALPVTGAMTNSYIIKFLDTSDLTDGTHTIVVTIKSKDGSVRAEKIFVNVKFYN